MITMTSRNGLIERAAEGIYSFSTGDASARIAEMNAAYGMARIRFALEKRGVDAGRSVCVFSPDGGITRNKERWMAGFGYGCLVRWPGVTEAGRTFAFPQIKPNACGILIAKLSEAPSVEKLWERLEAAKGGELSLEGSRLKLNLGVSNHFIEVCRIQNSLLPELADGDIVAAIHTSPNELKDELYDFERWADAGGVWEQTPFGPILVLEGEQAEQYYEIYKEIERFSWRKRLHLAKVMFGDFETISNETHQGLYAQNVAGLGVYRVGRMHGSSFNGDGPGGVPNVFALTLRPDLPIYLLRGRPNLSEGVLAETGSAARAAALGHSDILADADILPHGGGYRLLFEPEEITVSEDSNAGGQSAAGVKRYFHFHGSATAGGANGTAARGAIPGDGGSRTGASARSSQFVFSDPRELPYDYRGHQVLEKIRSLQLGDVVAQAQQVYTLKY